MYKTQPAPLCMHKMLNDQKLASQFSSKWDLMAISEECQGSRSPMQPFCSTVHYGGGVGRSQQCLEASKFRIRSTGGQNGQTSIVFNSNSGANQRPQSPIHPFSLFSCREQKFTSSFNNFFF